MRLNDILDAVNAYAPNADVDLLMRAYVYSAKAHQGQLRKSGEPYLIHPIAVAGILTELRMDVDTIATGLLHDTMEDCLATRGELAEEFGEDVAELVDGVTKIGKLEFRSKHEAQAENFRKLVLAMAKDVRVVLVKLADRLHNMRTMQHMNPERQLAISEETLDIFAPIANRLGLARLKSELEDLCFQYMHPEVHGELVDKLADGLADRETYIASFVGELEGYFKSRGLDCAVYGRSKHVHSIHRKMQDQNLEFEQVHDLLAFRIIVDDIGQCYTALGLTHAHYRHLPSRLKDYVANPKSNGYQSLHTVILGPSAHQVEVQIRTTEMHNIAEVGIAAHWRYKEGHLDLSREDISKFAKLRELFEAANEVDDPTEFLETVKVDLFSEEVFAFTPRGDVKFFPQGATVLDFAYAIHTEVGNHCSGAKVNNRMVPLRQVLRSGDRIEILTKNDQNPTRDWLDWARTGRALSKIRRHVREDERERGRTLGRDMLDNELKKHGHTFNKLYKSGEIKTACESLGFHRTEHLCVALAQGSIAMNKVLKELLPDAAIQEDDQPLSEGVVANFFKKLRRRSQSPVIIDGLEDVLVSYAQCCNPLPGERVEGFVTRGRGITVHVATCPQLLSLEVERRIDVEWQQEVKGSHTGELCIICTDKPGMLADIGASCKTIGVNVSRLEAKAIGDNKAQLNLDVQVQDVRELTRLMKNIKKIQGVLQVSRVRALAQR